MVAWYNGHVLAAECVQLIGLFPDPHTTFRCFHPASKENQTSSCGLRMHISYYLPFFGGVCLQVIFYLLVEVPG